MQAIIFDLNGVLIKSPKLTERFRDTYNVPLEASLSALKEIMGKVRMPNAGRAFPYWEPYLKQWGINISEEEFFDFWFSAEKEVTEMTALLRELKEKDIKIFILSNNFVERAKYYDETFGFIKELPEKIYYSWQTGFVKPDKRAYELILEENDLDPEQTIYFDDSEENIAVANSLRIESHLFASIEDLKSRLGV